MARYTLKALVIIVLLSNGMPISADAVKSSVPGSFAPTWKSFLPWTKQWKIERLFRRMSNKLDVGELPTKRDVELITKLIDKCGYNPLNRIRDHRPSFFLKFFENYLEHAQTLKMDKATVYYLKLNDWYGEADTELSAYLLVYSRLIRQLGQHYGMRYRAQEEEAIKTLIREKFKAIGFDAMNTFDASQPLSFFENIVSNFVLWNEALRFNFCEMNNIMQQSMDAYAFNEDAMNDLLFIFKHMRQNSECDALWDEPVSYLQHHSKLLLIAPAGREVRAQQLLDVLKKAGFIGIEYKMQTPAERHREFVARKAQQKKDREQVQQDVDIEREQE